MTDRIFLQNMRFEATHGYHDYEQHMAQPFEVDIELRLNLQPAGIDDDLTRTIDYGRVYEIVKRVMESTTYRLLEALAEAISHEILAVFDVLEVGVRSGSRPCSSAVHSTMQRWKSGGGGSSGAAVGAGSLLARFPGRER